MSGVAPENRLRFTGQYVDTETGLYHLRARQYDPANGRFGGVDPAESPPYVAADGAYVYAQAAPTFLTDPTGLWGRPHIPSWGEIKHAAGAAKDFTIGAGRLTGQTAASLAKNANPIVMTVHIGQGLFRTGKGCVQHPGRGCVDSFNENLNPAYGALVSLGACRDSWGAEAAGYNCAAALRDSAMFILGARGLARICFPRGIGGAPRGEIGPTGNPGAFPFEGITGLSSKAAAREALLGLDATSEQMQFANRAINRATSSSTINVGTYGDRVVVQIRRPGANGYQVVETSIARDGSRTVVQKGYDSSGNLHHYDPKYP